MNRSRRPRHLQNQLQNPLQDHRQAPRRPAWRRHRAAVVALAAAGLVAAVPGLRGFAARSPSAAVSALGWSPASVPAAPSMPAAASVPAAGSVPAAALAPARSTGAAPSRSGGTYRVVGLGDSVPAATACGCTSYVSLVAAGAASRQGRAAAVTNLAEGGLTTSGLAEQLTDSAVRAQVAAADLVIITVGANDFDPDILTTSACTPVPALPCYQPTLSSQRSRLAAVVADVGHLTAARHGAVLVTGYWNVFLDGEAARELGDDYVAASTALTRAENALLASVGTAHGATYVDLFTLFKGSDGTVDDTRLLAPDADHPNAAGHALIARGLLSALAARG